MAIIQTAASTANAATITATFASPVTAGNLIVAIHRYDFNSSEPKTPTATWTQHVDYKPATGRQLAVWSAPVTASTADSHEFGRVAGSGFASLILVEVSEAAGVGVTGTNYSAATSSFNVPATALAGVTSGSLLLSTIVGALGYPTNYTGPSGYLVEDDSLGTHLLQSRTADATSEGPITHSWTSGDTDPVGALIEVLVAVPTLRKGSQFTVEETLAGTVTSATLNGNAIQFDSHVGTTVTLTDTGSGITTSGEYPLVLTDDTAATETITVQVNVVGIASHTFQKDGAGLASLTDVEIIVHNSSGTEIVPEFVTTTDINANIPKQDFSSVSESVGDTVKVSVYSPSAQVGITYEQALELI